MAGPSLGDIGITLSDATQLIEEKVTRLRREVGYAEGQLRDAASKRDVAVEDVTRLQQDKDRLINENASLTQESERIKAALVEHRRNVEASLEKTEAKANVTIEQATKATEALKTQEHALRQLKSQLAGLKQTLHAEANALADQVLAVVARAREALAAIPD